MGDIQQITSFDEIRGISPETLETDRYLQRDIHYFIKRSSRDIHMINAEHPVNPYPVVVLTDTASAHIWNSMTFGIDDDTNIYFFEDAWPAEDLPDYLRAIDIIPSGIYAMSASNYKQAQAELDISSEAIMKALRTGDQEKMDVFGAGEMRFNKPVMRVNKDGGVPERYNASIKQWEQNDGWEYQPKS